MLIRQNYFKNILTLGSGTIFSQVLLLLIYPFLTRFYSTSDFGSFGLFSAIVFLVGDVVNGRYDLTIMLPDNNRKALGLLRISILIAALIGVVSSLLLFIFQNAVHHYYEMDGVELAAVVFPALLQFGIIQAGSSFLNRNKKYRQLSMTRLVQSAGIGIFSLVFVLIGWKENGLILGFIGGQFISMILLIYYLRKDIKPLLLLSNQEMMQSAREYSSFPKYSVLSAWLNNASRQIPFFLIPYYFGMEVLGMLALAYKILGTPLGIVSGSFSQIFYQKANRANSSGKDYLKRISKTTMQTLLLLGIVPTFIIVLWGPALFSWYSGKEWREAGIYAAWLMPWFYLLMVVSPISYLVNVLGLLRFELFYNIVLFCIRLLVIVICGMYLNALDTIKLFSITGIAFALFYLYYLIRKVYSVSLG